MRYIPPGGTGQLAVQLRSGKIERMEVCKTCTKPQITEAERKYLLAGGVDLGRCRCPHYARPVRR